MSQETKLAEEMLAGVAINTKTMGLLPNTEISKWVNVIDVVIEGGKKKFVVESSTGDNKSIKEAEVRFVNKHLGIRFLLSEPTKIPQEVKNE